MFSLTFLLHVKKIKLKYNKKKIENAQGKNSIISN